MTTQFTKDILKFNKMYGLPVNESPCIPFKTSTANGGTARLQLLERLKQFKKILHDEVSEVDEIIAKVAAGDEPLEVLTDLADWLGDIQVFCASEMLKFGLDNEVVLSIIMSSNFSKLQTDGTALMVDGKLQKGPNYWKPEPKLRRIIQACWHAFEQEEASQQTPHTGANIHGIGPDVGS